MFDLETNAKQNKMMNILFFFLLSAAGHASGFRTSWTHARTPTTTAPTVAPTSERIGARAWADPESSFLSNAMLTTASTLFQLHF